MDLTGACDLCRREEFEPFPAPAGVGRRFLRCRLCGLVTAGRTGQAGATAGSAQDGQGAGRVPRRDARLDRRRAAAVMRLLPSGKVLEIGCGEGSFLAELDPMRFEAVGLEADPILAGAARRRLERAGMRGGILDGALNEVDLPAEAFDLVAFFDSLGCAPSPRRSLMEACRLLRSGGCAIVETPSLASLTARLRGARWQPLRDPRVEFYFTPDSFHRLASCCGLDAGTVLPAVPLGWPAPGTFVRIARKSARLIRQRTLSEVAGSVSAMNPMPSAQ